MKLFGTAVEDEDDEEALVVLQYCELGSLASVLEVCQGTSKSLAKKMLTATDEFVKVGRVMVVIAVAVEVVVGGYGCDCSCSCSLVIGG